MSHAFYSISTRNQNRALSVFLSILTVETCDERTIPAVDNATYEIHRFMSENPTTNPPLFRQDISEPAYENVTNTQRFMSENTTTISSLQQNFSVPDYESATTVPPSLRQEFSIPKRVNVTYTCEKGYRLKDPNNNTIGCEYVTTPRKFKNGSIHDTVIAKAVWTSTEGIICEKGEKNC